MHLKRQISSKKWPIARKGTTYLVVPSHSKNTGVPLLVALRDYLGVVERRRELEKILHEKKVIVNGKNIKDDNLTLLIFDKVGIKSLNKYYKLNFSKTGKLILEEISEKESESKISKVINKKILKGNKIQINLIDGINIISKEKVNVGDSVKVNFKDKKIETVYPFKEKANVLMIKGSHLGIYGVVKKIDEKKVIVKSENEEFETKMEDLIVVD